MCVVKFSACAAHLRFYYVTDPIAHRGATLSIFSGRPGGRVLCCRDDACSYSLCFLDVVDRDRKRR